VDPEGDRYWTLKALHDSGEWFTVRSTYTHRFVYAGTLRRPQRLRDVARKGKLRGVLQMDLRERPGRKARAARLLVRTATVVLDMMEKHTDERLALPLHVVDVREIGPRPRGEDPLH
jgi:hypothetical protein